MALSSPRFASVQQCRDAANNSPVMKAGARGAGVAAVQQGLIDLGFPLPISTRRFGVPDGIFGGETSSRIRLFQTQQGLEPDGVVGRMTMSKMDALLPLPAPAVPTLPYLVPGFRIILAQPTSMVCWATVYTMMISWKRQQSMGIRQAVGDVAEKYGVLVDNNQGLPPEEFGPFITAAGMVVEPMMNLTITGWINLLGSKGLIWVGTLNSLGVNAGLHSRIVEGMTGDGSVDNTNMLIIDPDGGRRYSETFRDFIAKYEGAFGMASGDYFQIRHFR